MKKNKIIITNNAQCNLQREEAVTKKKFNNNMMYTHYTQYTLTCAGRLFDVFRITHVDIIFFFLHK